MKNIKGLFYESEEKTVALSDKLNRTTTGFNDTCRFQQINDNRAKADQPCMNGLFFALNFIFPVCPLDSPICPPDN